MYILKVFSVFFAKFSVFTEDYSIKFASNSVQTVYKSS